MEPSPQLLPRVWWWSELLGLRFTVINLLPQRDAAACLGERLGELQVYSFGMIIPKNSALGIVRRSLGMNLQLSSPFSSHLTWGF